MWLEKKFWIKPKSNIFKRVNFLKMYAYLTRACLTALCTEHQTAGPTRELEEHREQSKVQQEMFNKKAGGGEGMEGRSSHNQGGEREGGGAPGCSQTQDEGWNPYRLRKIRKVSVHRPFTIITQLSNRNYFT